MKAMLLARLRTLWSCIRQLSGDDAFERYRAHHLAGACGATPMSRGEFYAHEQRRKWSGVSRCC
jgi:uncharacterized short protein YbdD (DUF466 family)